MRLTFGITIFGSHIPGFDVTSTTVSGLLATINLAFSRMSSVPFRCSVDRGRVHSLCPRMMHDQWFLSCISFIWLVVDISVCQSII